MRPFNQIFESYGGWRYLKCCVDFSQKDVDQLEDMMDQAEEVTYDFLVHNVGKNVVAEVFHDYNWTRNPKNGLMMKDDYHVRYYQSRFLDEPCFYVVHSAIEFIFVRSDSKLSY